MWVFILANEKSLVWIYFQAGTWKSNLDVFKTFVWTTTIKRYPHSQHRVEEVVRRCSVKKVLSKVSKNSQKNTEVSFIKVAELQPATSWQRCFPACNFLAKMSPSLQLSGKGFSQPATFWQRCFPVIFTNFFGTPFYRTPV